MLWHYVQAGIHRIASLNLRVIELPLYEGDAGKAVAVSGRGVKIVSEEPATLSYKGLKYFTEKRTETAILTISSSVLQVNAKNFLTAEDVQFLRALGDHKAAVTSEP